MSTTSDIISFDHHVHYYPEFTWQSLFESCWKNLNTAGASFFSESQCHPAICLLETKDSKLFRELSTELCDSKEWQVSDQLTGPARLLEHIDGRKLTVLTGRQLVTVENLEVLIIGDDTPWAHVPTFNECLQKSTEHLLIIPWGVGKWLGRRGQAVSDAIDTYGEAIRLADNGGRPTLWSNVTQFKQARRLGLPILPGSDPLPLNGAEKNAGSNGVFIKGCLNDDNDVQQFLNSLRINNIADTYNSQQGIIEFLRSQIKIRVK